MSTTPVQKMNPQPSHVSMSFSGVPNQRGLLSLLFTFALQNRSWSQDFCWERSFLSQAAGCPSQTLGEGLSAPVHFPLCKPAVRLCQGQGTAVPIWEKWKRDREHSKPNQSSEDGWCPTWTKELITDRARGGGATGNRMLQKEQKMNCLSSQWV